MKKRIIAIATSCLITTAIVPHIISRTKNYTVDGFEVTSSSGGLFGHIHKVSSVTKHILWGTYEITLDKDIFHDHGGVIVWKNGNYYLGDNIISDENDPTLITNQGHSHRIIIQGVTV